MWCCVYCFIITEIIYFSWMFIFVPSVYYLFLPWSQSFTIWLLLKLLKRKNGVLYFNSLFFIYRIYLGNDVTSPFFLILGSPRTFDIVDFLPLVYLVVLRSVGTYGSRVVSCCSPSMWSMSLFPNGFSRPSN